VKPLLEQVAGEVRAFYTDGAYDHWEVRGYLKSEKISQITPPGKNT
jgi:hypothetical protein